MNMNIPNYQFEEPVEEQREQLEEILKSVPYNLSVACIKLCQVNGYMPLPVEKYYEHILPTFHLLRRTDGSKYQTTSIKTVRSAMTSEKIFERNDDGLYCINIKRAINFLRNLQKKVVQQGGIKISKKDRERERERSERSSVSSFGANLGFSGNFGTNMGALDNFGSSDLMPVEKKKYKKRKKKDELDDQGSTGGDSFNGFNMRKRQLQMSQMPQMPPMQQMPPMMQMPPMPQMRNPPPMCNRKLKPMVVKRVQKYEKAFELFQNLLKIFSRNAEVNQRLNFDFENIRSEDIDVSEDNPSMSKIIGMLSVFKFFKPFLEQSLDSCRQQEKIMSKINQVSDDLNYMHDLYDSQ